MKNRDELGTFLNDAGLLGVGAEVGVFAGVFSAQILSTWKGEALLLVDPWASIPGYQDFLRSPSGAWVDSMKSKPADWQKILDECRQRVERFGDRAHIMRMASFEAARTMGDGTLDFVYLDGDHSYEGVANDLRAWWPKVKVGGLFSGHDYFNGLRKGIRFGVKQAVDEFAKAQRLQLEITTEKHTMFTWYAFKPDVVKP